MLVVTHATNPINGGATEVRSANAPVTVPLKKRAAENERDVVHKNKSVEQSA